MSTSKQKSNNNNTTTSIGPDEITTQWAHYDNLAKLLSEAGTGKKRKQFGGICGLFSYAVTVTEKIDGSNLAMWVRHNPLISKDKKNKNAWEVLLLQGRNMPIWRKKHFDEFAERLKAKTNAKQQQQQAERKNENDDEILSKKLIASLEDDLNFMSTCLPQYGHAKKLGNLIYKMREFCIDVANELGLNEIEIFGEAFRAKKIFENNNNNNNNTSASSPPTSPKIERFAAFSSWHPFGYKDPSQEGNWELTRLTSSTHQLFSKFVILHGGISSPPQTHEELIQYLMTVQDHSVFPPPLMIIKSKADNAANADNRHESQNGNDDDSTTQQPSLIKTSNIKLIDAITGLLPTMINPPERAFEGVFIVAENGDFGCKFKTGTHDEQKRLPTLKDIGIIEDEEELKNALAEQELRLSKNPNYLSSPGIIKIDEEMTKKIKVIFGIMCKIFTMKIQAPEDVVRGGVLPSSPSSPSASPTTSPSTINPNTNGAVASFSESNKPEPDENWNKILKTLNSDIQTALDRELGKRLSFAHFKVGSEERQTVVDELIPLVIKEVLEVYEESDHLKMPYTKEALVKKVPQVVKANVDRVEYQPLE